MRAIFIAGHSHTACLGLIRRDDEGARVVEIQSEPRATVYGLSYSWPGPSLPELLIDHVAEKHLVLFWQGNHAQAKFNFVNCAPFDFVSSGMPGAPLMSSVRVLPESLIEASLMPSAGNLGVALGMLKDAGAASITVAGAPPPKRDEGFIRAAIMSEPFFVQQAQKLGQDPATIEITSSWVRLKLWKLLMQLHCDTAEKFGAGFLDVPPGCQDEDGFLLTAYCQDVTHANHKYGELLLSHVVSQVLSRYESDAKS